MSRSTNTGHRPTLQDTATDMGGLWQGRWSLGTRDTCSKCFRWPTTAWLLGSHAIPESSPQRSAHHNIHSSTPNPPPANKVKEMIGEKKRSKSRPLPAPGGIGDEDAGEGGLAAVHRARDQHPARQRAHSQAILSIQTIRPM
jgi:hypothetical protein